jgi:hypothetical protein
LILREIERRILMRVDPTKVRDAGIELWDIAQRYKRVYCSDLSDRMALKLAMLANPELGELYLGCPVRRDGMAEVKKFLLGE